MDETPHDSAARKAEATIQQLKAEIAAHPTYSSARKVAKALDMNYTTLTKNLAGEQGMRMMTVFSILELLDIPAAVFFDRVEGRVKQR